MTRFASRSSGFVLFAPCDPPALFSSRPWARRAHPKPCRGSTMWCKREDYPRVCECARARSLARSRVLVIVPVYIYMCTLVFILYASVRADRTYMRARTRLRACISCTACGNAGVHVGVFGYVLPDTATANEK